MAKQLEAGFHFHCIDCDITDWDSTRQAFEMVRENVGPIDVLVNNAGITRDGTLRKMPPENWKAVIDTNLTGLFNTTRQVIESMLAKGWGVSSTYPRSMDSGVSSARPTTLQPKPVSMVSAWLWPEK